MQPIRILHATYIMGYGGIESLLMNIYRRIDRDKIQFDFLVPDISRGAHEDEIESLGGRIYRMPRICARNFRHLSKWLDEFFEEHKEYKIVHAHIDTLSTLVLSAAKKHDVKVRIAHSHNSEFLFTGLKKIISRYLRLQIKRQSTDFFACGNSAGKFLFGESAIQSNKFVVLRNAIDIDKFKFDAAVREKMRDSLELTDKFVIGHVGRFTKQKNHQFLIDIFYEIQKQEPDSILLLIGDGTLKDQIESKACLLGINDKVIFTGNCSNVQDYLSAMDVFILPSLYEGLPFVLVETQAASLPAIVSDSVTNEMAITGLISFMSLDDAPENWAKIALSHKESVRDQSNLDKLRNIYGVDETTAWLQNFYLNKYYS